MGRGRDQPRREPPRTRRRAKYPAEHSYGALADDLDVDMPDADATTPTDFKFIVSIDYGTTYTSVSYAKIDIQDEDPCIELDEIRTIKNWPKAIGGPVPTEFTAVPSESWYANGKHYWGYDAFDKRVYGHIPEGSIVGAGFCPKIVLSRSTDTENGRQELRNALMAIGKEETEIVTDYLVEVLQHTKNQLGSSESYNDTCDVELILCVPAAWDAADRRGWQEIMGEASRRACFGSIFNFWMLHEPEAATAFVLERQSQVHKRKVKLNWKKGDIFIVCDAGGGTVDTIVYKIQNTDPPRVIEITKPEGDHCGSKYINDDLCKSVCGMLKSETYLEADGKTIKDIVNECVVSRFELGTKQNFCEENEDTSNDFRIPGLRANEEKNFQKSMLFVPSSVIADCFRESVNGVIRLIQMQYRAVTEAMENLPMERRRYPTQILLVGGFGNSSILQKAIQRECQKSQMRLVCDISGNLATMVSQGAVLRAVNKADGPQRQIHSNVGVLRNEEYNGGILEHGVYDALVHNEANGKTYVVDSICWLIKKNQKLETRHRKISPGYQIFRDGDRPWKLWETIYISDESRVRDGVPYNHGCNRSAIIAGQLEVDFSYLKEQGLVQAERRDETSPWFWEVKYDSEIVVEGLNLKFHVKWPQGGGEVQGQTAQIPLVAVFKPGTA